MSNVVVKQGTPSAPGTVVDTSKAKVVPPSDEVTAEHAKEAEFMARTDAEARAFAERAERDKLKKDQNAKVKAMRPGKAKPKAAAAKGSAKPAAKGKGGGGTSGPNRITAEWLSTKKRDVLVKDQVKLTNGTVIDVIGRWTKKTAKGNVPMVTGRIVSGEGKKGDRKNAVAAEVTHVAKAKA